MTVLHAFEQVRICGVGFSRQFNRRSFNRRSESTPTNVTTNLNWLDIHSSSMLTTTVVKHWKTPVIPSKSRAKVPAVSISHCCGFFHRYLIGHLDITGGPVPDQYQFLQFHMHWGSNDLEGAEHVVDGVRFPGEVREEESILHLFIVIGTITVFSYTLSHGIVADTEHRKPQQHRKISMV